MHYDVWRDVQIHKLRSPEEVTIRVKIPHSGDLVLYDN
jgi:hypothetical protein